MYENKLGLSSQLEKIFYVKIINALSANSYEDSATKGSVKKKRTDRQTDRDRPRTRILKLLAGA